MAAGEAQRAIDAVWRIESAKVVAVVARMVRDVGLAEELAQDALVIALERWPESGVPDNPGAWLMATAKHRAIDRLRRSKLLERKHEELGREAWISMSATRPCTSGSSGTSPARMRPRRNASSQSAGRTQSSPVVAAYPSLKTR